MDTNKVIVSVGVGSWFAKGIDRFEKTAREHGYDGDFLVWKNGYPEGSPTHQQVPYAFKTLAMLEAIEQRYDSALWVDAAIVVIKPLDALWEQIERDGYWIPLNGWDTGQWCADRALDPLGITRDQAFDIPHAMACAMGFDLRDRVTCAVLGEWKRLALETDAFKGPWNNKNHVCSQDDRVLGHRHDQTAIGVLAWRYGWRLTACPLHISYNQPNISPKSCLLAVGSMGLR